MNMNLEALRERAQAEIAGLRELERLPLTAGRTETFGTADLPLLLASDTDTRYPGRCFVSVGAGGNVPPIAQDLPCGILAADGRLLGARRTDRNGSFWLQPAEREFRLRFVNEVRDAVDVDVLVRLDDDAAYGQLDAALDGPELSETLRQRIRQLLRERGAANPEVGPPAEILEIARALVAFREANAGREVALQPIVAPALRRLDQASYDAWRCAPIANGDLGARTTSDEPRRSWHRDLDAARGELSVQESRNVWIAIRGDRIAVRAPAELVPYGVVRILAKDHDALVGTCLLPLIRYQTLRSNQWPMARVIGDRDPKSVTWHAQPATQELLSWFSADEVAALLDHFDVRDREELRDRVEQLLALVRQRDEETADG